MIGIEIRMVKKYFTAKEYAAFMKMELNEVRRLIAIGKIQIEFPNRHEKVVAYIPRIITKSMEKLKGKIYKGWDYRMKQINAIADKYPDGFVEISIK